MLKCLVCGETLYIVNNTHLRKHGLTIDEYKERFNAPIYGAEYWRRYWSGMAQRTYRLCQRPYNRLCQMCGSAFTTKSTNPNVVYCPRCRVKVRIEKRRRCQRRLWHKRKFKLSRKLVGTFGKRYCEVVNGRVLGAVLLERGISLNSSSPHNGEGLECEGCGSNMIIDVLGHKPYCSECRSEIVVAKENEYYSMPIEYCCSSCGLVYDTQNFPLFSVWGDLKRQISSTNPHPLFVKEKTFYSPRTFLRIGLSRSMVSNGCARWVSIETLSGSP